MKFLAGEGDLIASVLSYRVFFMSIGIGSSGLVVRFSTEEEGFFLCFLYGFIVSYNFCKSFCKVKFYRT